MDRNVGPTGSRCKSARASTTISLSRGSSGHRSAGTASSGISNRIGASWERGSSAKGNPSPSGAAPTSQNASGKKLQHVSHYRAMSVSEHSCNAKSPYYCQVGPGVRPNENSKIATHIIHQRPVCEWRSRVTPLFSGQQTATNRRQKPTASDRLMSSDRLFATTAR